MTHELGAPNDPDEVEAVAADRAAAAALQRALLPESLPVLPGVRTAVRHTPAGTGAGASGTWFDVIPCPDGAVGLVVGEVVGRGVDALAAMARLRGVLAERLGAGGSLEAALAALDACAAAVPATRGSTLLAARLEPWSGRLTYCTAGHPPPLVAGVDGVGRYLVGSGSPPLGVGGKGPRLVSAELARREMLVLYSNGVLTRPGRTPMRSTAELAHTVAETMANRAMPDGAPPEATERVCAQVSELLVRDTGFADDITLLVAQRVTAAGPLRLELPTKVETVRRVRLDLAMWLLAVGTGSEDVVALQHAVGEVVTNSIEHAPSRDGTGRITVDAVLDGQGVAHVDVVDDGHWLEPDLALPFRGNGLAMAGLLSDELRVLPGHDGTAVRVSRRLRRPVERALWRFDPPPGHGTLRVLLVGTTCLRLRGAVDVEGALTLRDDLLRHTRAGTVAMTLELGGLTHLCSAGVQVLYEAVDRSAQQGRALRLHGPAGSVADQVLAVAALAHDTGPLDA